MSGSPDWSWCIEHQREKVNEGLTLPTGVALDLWVCPDCDRETDDNLAAFADRIARGDFDD